MTDDRAPLSVVSTRQDDIRSLATGNRGTDDIVSPAEQPYPIEEDGFPRVMTSADLAASNARIKYLIEDVLVERQSCLLAGPHKSLKTSISADLALSLARSTPFLGRFKVPKQQRVLVLSAESGQAVILETAARIARSKGFNLENDTSVFWAFWVPRANDAEQLQALERRLQQCRATVLIFDPLYWSLDGESQANLAANAAQIHSIAQICTRHGSTFIAVDHIRKTSENAKRNKPLHLEDVAGAGKAEYFRQWLLISRREVFTPGHPHKLWMVAGGSAGHASQHRVDIDEAHDASGHRTWRVDTMSHGGKCHPELDDNRRSLSRNPFK